MPRHWLSDLVVAIPYAVTLAAILLPPIVALRRRSWKLALVAAGVGLLVSVLHFHIINESAEEYHMWLGQHLVQLPLTAVGLSVILTWFTLKITRKARQ